MGNVIVTYDTDVVWKRTGNNSWEGYAGKRPVATIGMHQCGVLCTTWFENYSDEQDNSVTGSLEFLQQYIQDEWEQYLKRLAGGN